MTTWVLLRGLTREAAHWGTFLTQFQHAMPGTHVIALDLPGNGLRHAEPSPATVAGMVTRCRAALLQAGRPGDDSATARPPFHILAMSLGAMVATAWANQFPQEVAGCVLINTSMRPFSPFYQRLRPGNYGTLLRFALWPGTPRASEQTVLHLTSNRARQHASLVADWAHVRQQRPVRAGNALRQLLAAARYRAHADAPVMPVLLLASAQDQLVNVACSYALAHAWDAALVVHPWAGHDLPLDDPAWVIGQVLQWINQAPAD